MGLGMPEVVLILVIALIVFGPRKLPELGKSLGQAMSQFRRASDDFKRTWEQEVEMETIRKTDSISGASSTYGDQGSPDSYSYDNYSSDSNDYIRDNTYETESDVASDTAKSQETTEANTETSTVAATPAANATPAPEKQRWI